MDERFKAFLLRRERTEKGIEADVEVIEFNGDRYSVRCVCRGDGTEIGAEGDVVPYLHQRYGGEAFCRAIRTAVMDGWRG